MTSSLERRFTTGRVELRMDKPRTFGGYAAKFDRQSKNLGGFVETIDRGFFARSAGRNWPEAMARYNHDDNMLLGTTAAGTLRLQVDEVGLRYEVDAPETRQDVVELVSRGDVSRSSFAFRVVEDDWEKNDQEYPLRHLVEGQLVDVAPVNSAAYDDTSVGMSRALPALESLSRKFEAPLEEVRRLAEAGELRRFFTRTDTPVEKKPLSAAAALALAKSIR